jgi:predicted esterase YcpF (UPF0227 family)
MHEKKIQPVVIYLHGFLSSPQSVKAQMTRKFVAQHYPKLTLVVPQIPNYPLEAIQVLESAIAEYPDRDYVFIGSSMGGFLSTYLVEKYGGRAVLINPAVKPFELFASFLGPHTNPYTGVDFILEQKHLLQLIELDTQTLNAPENYWVLLQTGDETLDYRLAEQKYRFSKLTIEQGVDHSFQGFDGFLADIFSFLLSSY